MCSGLYLPTNTLAVSTVADTEAAAANSATAIPATGIELVSMLRIVSSGRLARYW